MKILSQRITFRNIEYCKTTRPQFIGDCQDGMGGEQETNVNYRD